jgi:MFS family permease
MIVPDRIDESSLRYPGWRVVLACFLVALFIFGFGLYGHAVYLAELQRLHGWSTGLISNASTLSFLIGSLLAAFTSDVMVRIGAGRFLLCGIAALAASTTLLAFAETPVQLYAAYILLACGWMGMGTVVIATIVSSWFDRRRGLAISIAFNGATFGGIIIAPMLVVLVGRIGFTRAMLTMTAVMLVVLVPAVIGLIGVSAPARGSGLRNQDAAVAGKPAASSRWLLLRNLRFWSIAAPFAIALLAQVGFIVHQIALLEPTMGRALAGLAVAVTTTMAVIGRLCLGLVVDRLDPRVVTAVSLVTQATALFVVAQTTDTVILFIACAVYGFSIGNLITLPPLIVHREFEPAAFGTVLGLSTAVCGIVSAFGPGLVGFVRGATGSYTAALMLCLSLQLVSAAIVLCGRVARRVKDGERNG